ncbi:B-cell differentiation antigen CD72 [Fukomys damarensis]|uniref:B-cell differentiation antigen CD72 n=1 Tax=Fukomys damarensis TaxID=885580 RepID=UPI0005400587|nr:B-cell differentiation antigen CD72 [Fukomys damarensis]
MRGETGGAKVLRTMADAITYADLRFVKAPLKKSVSGRLGPDAEAYEDGDGDGDLTYENVQVPTVPGGVGLASSGVGDRAGRPPSAGVSSEQKTASWIFAKSPAVARILSCPASCLQHLLLGLLLTCLLLGVAVICLGVRYLQVSQQLQHMNRVLEATNSSLRQQLHQRIAQLGQKEEDLQESSKELAQSQEALQEEQRGHQAVKEQLNSCQADREKTKEALQEKEKQREALELRLRTMHNILKPFFTCPSEDTCCLMGWTLHEKRCFYFSPTEKTWEESQNHCTSLSSKLATLGQRNQYLALPSSFDKLLSDGGADTYWIDLNTDNVRQMTWSNDRSNYWYSSQTKNCAKVQKLEWRSRWQIARDCTQSFRYICELAAFKFPDWDHSLQ